MVGVVVSVDGVTMKGGARGAVVGTYGGVTGVGRVVLVGETEEIEEVGAGMLKRRVGAVAGGR